MYKKERTIKEAILDTFFKDFCQRGFKNKKIITDWHLIFSNAKNIDPSIFRPTRQNISTLFVSTSDMDFYTKFNFFKRDIISEINTYLGEDIKEIKIKFMPI